MTGTGPKFGFGLYVHWPYCTRICPYCDFNVYAAKDRDTAPLFDAILADLKAQHHRLSAHPEVQSVFFGGGTPSLMAPAQMARLLEGVNDTYGLAANAEITLEANPNDVLRSDLSSWVAAGINRLSLGIQSLRDEALQFLGRDHDRGQALRAIDAAQSTFDNHSLDLIYARPGQSLGDWDAELTEVLSLGAPHLSLYELTIETRTAFGQRAARGDLVPMEDDDQADLYERTQSLCDAAGLPAYEVSNHARAPEFESRHNHIYWASGDWLGIGPGAHGRLCIDGKRVATEAPRRPADYLNNQAPMETLLSHTDTVREFLPMALRPLKGLDLKRFERVVGAPPAASVLEDLTANGLAHVEHDRLYLTVAGRLMADHIAGLLLPQE